MNTRSLRRRLAILCACIMATHTTFAQLIPEPDPTHSLIYKVNAKCGDTLQVTRHPTSLRITPTSRTRCPIELGFGEVFWKRKEYLLIVEANALYLMVGAMHKDKLLDLSPGLQTVASPYGAYKVRVTEDALLFGKWKTYLAEFRPETSKTVVLLLRFNAQLGIMSLENQGPKGAKIGFLELQSIDGKPVAQFVQESKIP
jgi:hypothetical protein